MFLVLIIIMLVGLLPVMAHVSFAESEEIYKTADKAREEYTIGQVRWLEEMPFGYGSVAVQVIDPDKNLDPDKQDHFEVVVYSKTFVSGADFNVYETGNNTGIFEGQVFIIDVGKDVPGEGPKTSAERYDLLVLQYIDETLPSYLDITSTTVRIEAFNTIFTEHDPGNKFGRDAREFVIPQSPREQINSGIPPDYIECKQYRYLFFKTHSNHPVCLKYESIKKLYERNWITQHIPLYLVTPEEYKIDKKGSKYDYASFLEVPVGLDEVDTINRISFYNVTKMTSEHYIKDGTPILTVDYIRDPDTGTITGKTVKKINPDTGTIDEYTVYR